MRVAGVAGLGIVIAVVSGAPACSQTAPALAQLVVVIDTDAHLVGELGGLPDGGAPSGDDASVARVSPDATIDTLRIDVLDDQNRLVDFHAFVVADPSSWPLSFGIQPSSRFGSEVRVWVRAFRALFASSGRAASASGSSDAGAATLDPPPQVTIDRLIALPLPSSGIQQVHVTLRNDCIGTPSGFGSPLHTCLGSGQLSGDPHQGLDSGGIGPPSSVGDWQPAIEVPCKSAAPSGRACIPGGFFLLGDLDAAGVGYLSDYEPVPLRPVVMSPFQLDKVEFTVGRFRSLVNDGTFTGTLPTAMASADPSNAFCTWLAAQDGSHDTLPLNCVPYATAQQVCQLVGGSLPTEAQWEYAARGRGQRRRYPWGDTEPQCCSASLNRMGPPPNLPMMCPGKGLEPVGSHAASAACTSTGVAGTTLEIGDVTRDGVEDMAGSVSEALGDFLQGYSAPCWNTSGLLRDPACQGVSNASRVLRGAYWNAGLGEALLPLRNSVASNGGPTEGFRCAYADGAP